MQNSCAPVEQRKSCEGARTTAISYFVRKKGSVKWFRHVLLFLEGKGAGNAIIKSCVFSLYRSHATTEIRVYTGPFAKKESCNNATPAMDRAIEDSIRVTQLIDCA